SRSAGSTRAAPRGSVQTSDPLHGPCVPDPPHRCSDLFGSMARGKLCARPPDIYAGEQEQPDHIDKVPVPGGELEPEVLSRGEMTEIGADQADDQECRADDDMCAVEAGRHEKGGAIDVAAEIERRMAVLVDLDARE